MISTIIIAILVVALTYACYRWWWWRHNVPSWAYRAATDAQHLTSLLLDEPLEIDTLRRRLRRCLARAKELRDERDYWWFREEVVSRKADMVLAQARQWKAKHDYWKRNAIHLMAKGSMAITQTEDEIWGDKRRNVTLGRPE